MMSWPALEILIPGDREVSYLGGEKTFDNDATEKAPSVAVCGKSRPWPCPRMRANDSPLGQRPKKAEGFQGSQSPIPAAADFLRSLPGRLPRQPPGSFVTVTRLFPDQRPRFPPRHPDLKRSRRRPAAGSRAAAIRSLQYPAWAHCEHESAAQAQCGPPG